MRTLIVLFGLVLLAILTTEEDPVMRGLKSHYYKFINELPDEYHRIKKPYVVTGTYYKGDIGSNVNKGGEIYVCVEDSVNNAFHVLLHELAHSMVTEYDHSSSFWEKFHELREFAIRRGYYKTISNKKYCGSVISDDRV